MFVPKKRVAVVKVDSGDYAGLEIKLSLSVSMGDFIDFQKNRFGPKSDIDTQQEAMRWFAEEVIDSWNYAPAEDSDPFEVNYDNFVTLEPALTLSIMNRWREVITDIETPLGLESSDGSPSAEVSTQQQERKSRSRRRP